MEIIEILKKPEFYDHFGLVIFSYITFLSTWMLYTKKKPERIVIWILLVIGILGIIVDGTILVLTKTLFMGGRT